MEQGEKAASNINISLAALLDYEKQKVTWSYGSGNRAHDNAAVAGSFRNRSKWGRREGTSGVIHGGWSQTATSFATCSAAEKNSPCPYPPASNDDPNPDQ